MLCQKMLFKFRMLDKTLFLKYAMGCLEALVKEGRISQEDADAVMKEFLNVDKPLPEKLYKLWPIAIPKLISTAISQGKFKNFEALIDKDVIREYFWFSHRNVVMRRSPEDKEFCWVLPAKVKKVEGDNAIVSTRFSEAAVKLDYVKEEQVKENDLIAIHRGYACEKITQKEFDELSKDL